MDQEKDNFEDSLTPEELANLDIQLIQELNHDDDENDHEPAKSNKIRNPYIIKVLGLLILLAFMTAVWSNWLWILSIMPLDFLTESPKLSKDKSIQNYQKAVVMIHSNGRQGTGFNIDSNGLVITNDHVIEGGKNPEVSFQDGILYSAVIQNRYPDIDLAVLKIKGKNLPSLEIGMNTLPEKGNEVIIIGNPHGFSDVIMKGSVAGELKLQNWDVPVLMIKGKVRKGSSGSPVLDSNGQVVAVIFGTADLKQKNNTSETVGLAVPINNLKMP